MVYTNSRAKIKFWDPHTKKFKYFSSEVFDEYNNKFGKGWSPGYEIMLGTNNYTFTTLKIDFSDHPYIKCSIFEVNVNLPPRGTPIGIVAKYCEHQNM